jgi:hypothetical protein
MIKSRRVRWAGHVARKGKKKKKKKKKNAYRILVESQKERDHREDEGIGGWTIK